MKAATAFCLSLSLFIPGATPAGAEPSLVHLTSLGAGGVDVAVDSAGNAIVLGYRRSMGGYFLAKLSPADELIFMRPLELPPREPSDPPREPLDVAVDPAGYIYVSGYANYAYECCEGSDLFNVGFVAKIGPDGTGLLYDTYFWDGVNTQAHDLAVDARGWAHVHYTSRWPDKYGIPMSGGMSFNPAGSLQGGFGFPNAVYSYANAMAMGPSGDLFTVGWEYPDWDSWTLFLQKKEASSGAVIETLLDNSGTIELFDVAGGPGGGSVVMGMVGEIVSPGVPKGGGFYIAGFGPEGEEVFSRVLNLGAVVISDVAVTSSGKIILAGWSGASGAFVLWLDGGTGQVLSSIPLGGPRYLDFYSIAVGQRGDAYVIGSGLIARLSENRPPDCSRSTAGPSVIWPPNGKMIPVSILGVTDPEGDPVALTVTGISQDEPGTAFSGIGSSVAQVKAERDGKGDGRVYRIGFQATDPSGESCAGQVTVCVPHDQGGDEESCANSGASASSSR